MRVVGPTSVAAQLRVSQRDAEIQPRTPRDAVATADLAYREVTAPRADLSRLIVDVRPGREHPLLQREVDDLRLRAHIRGDAPTDPGRPPSLPPGCTAAPEADEDTLPLGFARSPGRAEIPAWQRQIAAAASPAPAAGRDATVVERSSGQLPGRPTSRRRPAPPSVLEGPAEATAPRARVPRGGRPVGSTLRNMQRMLDHGFVMMRGFKGDEVVLLQTLLRRRGFRVRTTGVIDEDTELAVRALQRRVGLPASGVVDLQVLNVLKGPR